MHRRHFVQTLTGLSAATALTGLSPPAIAAAAGSAAPTAPKTSRPLPRFGDGRDWFFEKRFGMFVHWGLYAIPGWHEQHQWRARVPRAEFVKLARQWNPTKFDPNAWLDLLQEGGMQYVCLTTKHHDGFCLW